MNPELIGVAIVDDAEPFRAGLRSLLSATPDMKVTGEAVTGRQAVLLAERVQPDVILMDLNMPDMDGIEATRRIVSTSPHIAVLVLTMLQGDDSVFAAMQAGARGYLLKGASKADILGAIRDVASGAAIFGPGIAQRLMTYFERIRGTAVSTAFPELTEREIEVLRLIAMHRSNAEIARELHLSDKTVRNHCSNIYAKLQVADRAEAVARARDTGMGGRADR